MKKLTYILSLLIVSGILFTGCYTQLATRDRNYTNNGNDQTYSNNNDGGYAEQYQDSVYDDSSEYYGDNYYDSSGYNDNYGDNNYYDNGNNSPYYDDFYYNYPSYRRYFWGYHPSITIGFGWSNWYYGNNWYYDPFYCDYWNSWYYPGSWSCLPYYYYYPSPFYFGFNYYNGFGYSTHNYYTNRERTRDIGRIRNLDGLRGGRGRGLVSSTGSVGKVRTSTDARISTRTNNPETGLRNNGSGITGENSRIREGRTSVNKSPGIERNGNTRNSGRINPYVRRNHAPSVGNRNDGNRRYYTPRSHYPNRREYTPRKDQRTGKYIAPKRNTSREYSPSHRNSSPRSYSPPQHSYSPPQRSYNPPAHSSNGGGGRSSGNSSGRRR